MGRGLTYRRLGVLVAGLGKDSALTRSVRRNPLEGSDESGEMSPEEEMAAWGLEHHLLALIADLLAGANWQRGGGKGSKPRPIPRPGVSDEPTGTRDGVPSGRIGGRTKSSLTPEQKIEVLRRIGPPRNDEDNLEDD